MGWEKECPLRAQLPVSASVVGRHDIVVGGEVGIDCLVTDLKDASDAATDRHSPAIIVISLPVGRNEGARGQVPALGEVIIEEGLQRHGIDVGAVLVAGEGPEVKYQKAGGYSALSDKNTTKPGPADYFPDPSSTSVAVGN